MTLRSLLTVLTAAACLTVPALAGKSSVRLVVDRTIEPTTTYELRFDDAMIPPEKVGQMAETPPLIFRPAIKGSFVWLSQRSGTFKPEEPLALSSTYRLLLAPGLKKADGKPLETEFSETIQTPPMQLKGWNSPSGRSNADAPAEPKFAVLFNVNVEPSVAGRFFKYVNGSGEEVPARVERADPAKEPTQYFPVWRSSDRSLRTWTERFYEKSTSPSGLEARPVVASGSNHLWIAPVQPLPAAEGWRLIVCAGLPSSDAGLRLLDPVEIKIGTIRPFEVKSAEATNEIDAGRRLSLRFSKGIAKDVTAENLSRWVRVQPEPRNFKADLKLGEWRIEFTGDFELAREYRVTVEPGLPSAEPFVLASGFSKIVKFSQVPPRHENPFAQGQIIGVNPVTGGHGYTTATATITSGTSTSSQWSLLSYLGRVNYNYADKYFLFLQGILHILHWRYSGFTHDGHFT